MAKPKDNATLQARFGFVDKDLTTPKHDAIMMWLDDHMEELLDEHVERPSATTTRDAVRQELGSVVQISRHGYNPRGLEFPDGVDRDAAIETIIDVAMAHAPEVPERVVRKRWEQPVQSGNYTIGFVDMQVEVDEGFVRFGGSRFVTAWLDRARLWADEEYRRRRASGAGLSGWPADQRSAPLPTADDLEAMVGDAWTAGTLPWVRLMFEVKTTIPSMGELVRQIRMYEPHVGGGWLWTRHMEHGPSSPRPAFVVVSPDDRFADRIRGQGIDFWKAPDL